MISIILPSLFQPLGERCLEAIERCSRNVDYEVVLVGPWRPATRSMRVKHILEETPRGAVHAASVGYDKAQGDFVVQMCDDALPLPSWLAAALKHIEIYGDPGCVSIHQGDYLEATTEETGGRPGLFKAAHGWAGTCFGRLYANFPFMSRKWADKVGYHRADLYVSHCADSSLGMEVWHQGGRVELLTNAMGGPQPGVKWAEDRLGCVESEHKVHPTTRVLDESRFNQKWGHIFGRTGGWDRGVFNVDIPPGMLPCVLENRTIQVGPEVREWARRFRMNTGLPPAWTQEEQPSAPPSSPETEPS